MHAVEVTVPISLSAALMGGSISLEHLDGRRISIPLGSDVITPRTIRTVKNEGMPISKQPGAKGDLHVHFDVQFPRSLSEAQKQALRTALPA